MDRRRMASTLLAGCCHESERAELVGVNLEGLRNSLSKELQPHLSGVIQEVHRSSSLLRDLADQAQVHITRVPVVIDLLNIILPCYSKTLRDITEHYEDRSKPKERRWKSMYHKMSEELPGTTLPARFMMYNQFLSSLTWLLVKSPNFDMNMFESIKGRIMQLREARGIPPPSPIQETSLLRRQRSSYWGQETNSHWAESIFTQPLPTKSTPLKRPRSPSEAYGPLVRYGHINMASDARTIVMRSFDAERLSVTILLQTPAEAPYLFVRQRTPEGPWVTMRGAHELCMSQQRRESLMLSRWSKTEQRSKPWANLNFETWEELILFYCTFICLKARSPLTIGLSPSEIDVFKETRLFQAQILDDGYQHSLGVFEDPKSGSIRLHAAVWEGELKGCPVWTAFLPYTRGKPDQKSWMFRRTRHKVWVRDIQPYIFCQRYRPVKRKKGNIVAFELDFVNEKGAVKFKELFDPEPPSLTATVESETDEEAADGA